MSETTTIEAETETREDLFGGQRAKILVVLMAICFVSHLNRVSISVVGTEQLIGKAEITETQMGTVYSAFLLLYSIFMIGGGYFIDRVGVRAALILMGASTAFFGVCTGAIGLLGLTGTSLLSALLGIRSLMGICTTPLHPGCARVAGLVFPLKKQPLANGMINGGALLGIALTYKIVGELTDFFGWPIALMITGASTGGVIAVWALVSGRVPLAQAREPRGRAGFSFELLGNSRLLWLTLSYAAVGYFQYLFFYWIQFYFANVLHFDKSDSRFYAGLPTMAMTVGMPLGGSLSSLLQRRFGDERGLAVLAAGGMLASAGFLAAGLMLNNAMAIVACFTLSLGILGFSEGPCWTKAVQLGGANAGTAAAIMNTGGNGIGLLAPAFTPLLAKYFGWQEGMAVGAIVLVLGALCWLGVARNHRE